MPIHSARALAALTGSLAALSLGGCGPEAVDAELAIVGATLIPMDGPAVPDATVLVRDGRIVALGPRAAVRPTERAELIDAAGGYLVPGLWDLHVHVLNPGAPELAFPGLVANGVTGVRDMNGALSLDSIARLKRALDEGTVVGPRLVVAGRLVDGPARSPGARGPNTAVVTSVDEARAAVDRLADDGADFIKVYHALPLDLLRAVAEEAGARGLTVVGHFPLVARADSAAPLLRSAEHLQGIFESTSPQGDSLRALYQHLIALLSEGSPPTPEMAAEVGRLRRAVASGVDPVRLEALIDRLAEVGTVQVPTLASNRGLYLIPFDAGRTDDPRFGGLAESVRSSWQRAGSPYGGDSAGARAHFAALLDLVRAMKGAGVPVLPGTDLGVPWVYPGSGLHDELGLLVEAGFTPEEALRAATIEAARFLGLRDSLGAIATGQVADLLLLEADPREDIAAVRQIRGVALRGRWLDRRALDSLAAGSD
ncbi:MAG: amidohydrolase family protein [Gemmatimonadales bacterium]